MINFTTNNQESSKEIEIASKNLPNSFYLEIDTIYRDALHSASHIWLFPYSNGNYCRKEEVFTYFTKSEFAKYQEQTKDFLAEETILITTSKIPKEYDFIEIYSLGYGDYKLEMEISFSTIMKDEKKKHLFGYQKSFNDYSSFYVNNGICSNIDIGTIGRVSDGWKFYPKFLEDNRDRKEIVAKYAL